MLRPKKCHWLDKIDIGSLCGLILMVGVIVHIFAIEHYHLVWRDRRPFLDAPISFKIFGAVLSLLTLIVIKEIAIMQRRKIRWGTRDGRYRDSPMRWEGIILTVVPGITFGITGLGLLINSAFDGSPEQSHLSKVAQMYILCDSKGHQMYYMNVTDWKNLHGIVILQLNYQTFQTYREGKQITIKTKHGFLGHEWITEWK